MSSAAQQDRVWAVVLAGGQGARLRPLTRRLYGEARPKQFAAIAGSRSLLRQTLDRVALAIPRDRTLVVTLKEHTGYLAAEFAGAPAPRLLVQPADRGTATAVLFAAHRISYWDPEATIVLFPSDHFILEETLFMGHVVDVAAVLRQRPRWCILLGAQPTDPEPEYGWVEPGEMLGRVALGPLHRVRRFWEKPSPEIARACLAAGCLWNTFVVVAKASTLIDLGRRFLPGLHSQLARIARFADTEDEPRAIQEAYLLAADANFSYAILGRCPPLLVLSRLPALTWCDWGTPERVLKSLSRIGIASPWSAVAEQHQEKSHAGT